MVPLNESSSLTSGVTVADIFYFVSKKHLIHAHSKFDSHSMFISPENYGFVCDVVLSEDI